MNSYGVGDLLVAGVGITDGVFDGAVVLLLDADEAGTVGVVLNKIADIELSAALPAWARLVSEPQALFDGGPVSQQGAALDSSRDIMTCATNFQCFARGSCASLPPPVRPEGLRRCPHPPPSPGSRRNSSFCRAA